MRNNCRVGEGNPSLRKLDSILTGKCPANPALPACGRQGRGASLLAIEY